MATRPLLVVNVSGDQVAMGTQHGELVRAAGGYEAVLDYYPRMPRVLLGEGMGRAMPLVGPLLDLAARRLERRRPAVYRDRSRAFFRGLGLRADYSRT